MILRVAVDRDEFGAMANAVFPASRKTVHW
jgi:hypothetical protein